MCPEGSIEEILNEFRWRIIFSYAQNNVWGLHLFR